MLLGEFLILWLFFQATWRVNRALLGKFYSISENRWMTTEFFTEWLAKFTALVTERPLLNIFDGHWTLISIIVIEKAIEDATILKFTPCLTDESQPL